MTEWFQCEFCPCLFCSKGDLDLHMKVFSSDSVVHGWTFQYCGSREDNEAMKILWEEHGGADKSVVEITQIVKRGNI